jgi:beta-alanine--pyruvate transaminase
MMDIIDDEALVERAAALIPHFHAAVMSLRDHPSVRDIRVAGLMAGVEVNARGAAGAFGGALQKAMFWNGLSVKFTGDSAILAPMFIAEPADVDEIVGKFRATLDQHA